MRPRHWTLTGAIGMLLSTAIGCHMNSPYGSPYGGGGYGYPAYNGAPMYNGTPQPIPNGGTLPPGYSQPGGYSPAPGGSQPPSFDQPFPADGGYQGLPPSNDPGDPYGSAPPYEGNQTDFRNNSGATNTGVPDYTDPGNFTEPSPSNDSGDPFDDNRDSKFEEDFGSFTPVNPRSGGQQVSVTSFPANTFVESPTAPARLPANSTSSAAPVQMFDTKDQMFDSKDQMFDAKDQMFESEDMVYNYDKQNYRWLSGRLSYDQRERTWYLMYNLRPGQNDRFGGDIGLTGVGVSRLTSQYEQAPIRVNGYVDQNSRDSQGKPRYYVQSVSLLKTQGAQ